MVDPRLAFLARASARWFLVEAGEMDLGIAFAELVPAFRQSQHRALAMARCFPVGSSLTARGHAIGASSNGQPHESCWNRPKELLGGPRLEKGY
jgi:hypothetical protein